VTQRVVGPGFYQRVFEAVREVPAGWITTYGDVAGFLGARSVARQVGWAMARCPEDVPWHRVVSATGRLSGVATRCQTQRMRLRAEGVDFDERERVRVRTQRWVFEDG
jgi:methylated-DNA-protein-cysteine methyltransferase-like protein